MVLLRFAHVFVGGGAGVEQHLELLDRTLLERNAWTIIRILLSEQTSQPCEERISMGRGQLVMVSVPVSGTGVPELLRQDNQEAKRPWLREWVRDGLLCNPLSWSLYGRRYVTNRAIPRRAGEPAGIGGIVSDLVSRYRVDVIMLHFQGGADADDVIRTARANGIPFGIVNHFANERFRHLSMRKHALLADGVAGVSGIRVPGYLAGRFVNLSNGIDTLFFSRAAAGNPDGGRPPVLLLPARIVRNKGHLDLIAAAQELAREAIPFEVQLAGREEPGQFSGRLRSEIRNAGLDGRVRYLGVLDQNALKQAYAAAALVVLPTYHHEGLPRVLIEAQAMELPVVAYDSGGVADALLPGETGFLVRPGNTKGLVRRLRELIENPALRRKMGQAGRRFVERRFGLAALAERHEAFYRGLAPSLHPRPHPRGQRPDPIRT